MDGFSKLPKMQCFKVGGSVKKEAYCGGGKAMKSGGEVSDKAQDKAMIKKAFKQHDNAVHDKEPTEIKLKKGGRSKKEVGTVKKFKGGGAIYGAKKDAKDIESIKEAKETKPKMIKTGGGMTKTKKAAEAKPSPLPKETAVEDKMPFKKGGKIKKFQVGGLTGPMGPMDVSEMERRKRMQAAMQGLTPDMLRQLQQQMPPSQQQAAGMQAMPMPQPMPQPRAMPQGMPGQLPPGMMGQ